MWYLCCVVGVWLCALMLCVVVFVVVGVQCCVDVLYMMVLLFMCMMIGLTLSVCCCIVNQCIDGVCCWWL